MINLNLEIADTHIKRSHGLMDRKELGENNGMIFIFPRKYKQSFWMQNTYIPLDIAFLDDSGSIFQIESMSPLNTRFTTSTKACKYAIEVNKGWFSKNNIDVGFQMFDKKDWINNLKGNLSYYTPQSRFAQVAVENEEIMIEPNELEGELTPEMENDIQPQDQIQDQTQEEMYQQPPQPDQVVEYNMNQAAKIKYAELNNKEMNIVYWTLSGKILPPRRLIPVPGEGYPIKTGPNGRYFVAYDSSPTINGDGWKIEGGTPKNFLIDNIISLEILLDEGVSSQQQEQTIEEPQNLWDRLKNNIF